MSTYAWIIDVDHLAEANEPAPSNLNAAGLTGPHLADPMRLEWLRVGDGHPFRMYDDDGNLYYEGRLSGDRNSDQGFKPLDDFGTGNAGACRIDYLQPDGTWETL